MRRGRRDGERFDGRRDAGDVQGPTGRGLLLLLRDLDERLDDLPAHLVELRRRDPDRREIGTQPGHRLRRPPYGVRREGGRTLGVVGQLTRESVDAIQIAVARSRLDVVDERDDGVQLTLGQERPYAHPGRGDHDDRDDAQADEEHRSEAPRARRLRSVRHTVSVDGVDASAGAPRRGQRSRRRPGRSAGPRHQARSRAACPTGRPRAGPRWPSRRRRSLPGRRAEP